MFVGSKDLPLRSSCSLYLSTHKEKWVSVFWIHRIGFYVVCFLNGRKMLNSVSFRSIDYCLVVTITVVGLTNHGISIRCPICVTITIACYHLEVSKSSFEHAFGIGFINQLLDLFRN